MLEVRRFLFPTIGLLALLSACAGPEESARPDPVEMSQFKKGSVRFDVVSAVGKPEWTLQRAGRPCDVYKLYTAGLGAGAKAAMAISEGITDVATLGLAEVAWSGVHAGTRPRIHTVLFCPGAPPQDDILVDVYDKDPSRDTKSLHTIVDAGIYSTPVVLPAAIAAPGLPSAPAGQISLDNVSREASPGGVVTGATQAAVLAAVTAVPIGPNTAADTLNGISATKATAANAPAFAVHAPASAVATAHPTAPATAE
jgi:hypothetical protein